MYYVVQYGDSLTGLGRRFLGDANGWRKIALINRISPARQLYVGQVLFIPGGRGVAAFPAIGNGGPAGIAPLGPDQPATDIPGRAFFFVLADEVNPLSRKLVRRVALVVDPVDPALLAQIMNPDRFGFTPREPSSSVSVARHVIQNRTDSRFISASERPLGSPRFSGRPFWIDAAKAQASGARIVEAEQIAQDIDRIAANPRSAKDPELMEKITRIRNLSRNVDREVLIEGAIPAEAVKGASAMAATRVFQFVSGVGIVLTVYDLGSAARRSVETQSVRPIAMESARQAGGWAGALAGAELGGMAGAAVGIETGPGAVVTGAIGSVVFGVAGFMGADWIAHWAAGSR